MKIPNQHAVKKKKIFGFLHRTATAPILAILLFLSGSGIATALEDKPITKTVFKVSDFKGQTFFEFLTQKGGLKEALDKDLNTPLELVDIDELHKLVEKRFDSGVMRKLFYLFKDGSKGFDTVFIEIENEIKKGTVITPDNIAGKIRQIMTAKKLLRDASKGGLAPLIAAPIIAMGSRGGTTVIIDEQNYFLNYGYKAGGKSASKDELAAALKSGRNFGAGPTHGALDASDTYFLRSLDTYLSGKESPEGLWEAVINVLTDCDTSGYGKLSKEAQAVATDFLTIYTAELDRHAMVNFVNSAHPWENDLAEAMFTSLFVKKNGGFMFGDKSVRGKAPILVKGKPEMFFGIGTQGSGIGVNRMERRALQTLLTQAIEDSHPAEVAEIRTLIGKKNGDIIRGMMEFINNPKNQELVRQNGAKINRSFGKIMAIIHDESPKLLGYFSDPGADAPVLKKKFIGVICSSYLKE